MPAADVGLEGVTVVGLSLNLSNGGAAFDEIGKVSSGGTETIWVDDTLPADATSTSIRPDGNVEAWDPSTSNPAPLSGNVDFQTAVVSGVHQLAFWNSTTPLVVSAGDMLYADVWLDPAHMPSEVALSWDDGSGTWDHGAYWGEDLVVPWEHGTEADYPMGALPAGGGWVRLEVPAADVGLEGVNIVAMALVLYDGRAAIEDAGTLPGPQQTTWFDGTVPAGANAFRVNNGSWIWGSSSPAPHSGSLDVQMPDIPEVQTDFFGPSTLTSGLSVDTGDSLTAWIYLTPGSVPSEVMIEWLDSSGSWAHRAYWGSDLLDPADYDTAADYPMGTLPATGGWRELVVPAADVGLEGVTVVGLALSLSNGGADFDEMGKVSSGATETIWVDDTLPADTEAFYSAGGNEAWDPSTSNPAPLSGNVDFQTAVVSGVHQLAFWNSTTPLVASAGDVLYADVWLDPAHMPSEVGLSWDDGSGTWDHGAYWGDDLVVPWEHGTEGDYPMGELPAAGGWVRLEVPAADVGLEGVNIVRPWRWYSTTAAPPSKTREQSRRPASTTPRRTSTTPTMSSSPSRIPTRRMPAVTRASATTRRET